MDYSIWETIEGKKLKIKDMKIKHIENCIKLIKRSELPEQRHPSEMSRMVDFELYKPYLEVFET